MTDTAIIVTNGKLASLDGKTAHGLIRGTSRFAILGVIDHAHAGRDAGEVVDGIPNGIPIYACVNDFIERQPEKPDYCIIGVALSGGRLPGDFTRTIQQALEGGISVISGLHQHLSDNPGFREIAARNGAKLIDIRKPSPASELHFWNGQVLGVTTPKIAVLGMDCTVGKRTTCRLVLDSCLENGIRAEMIYTGQTGWLQGYKYGFILDATPNDFVSGEIERAIVACDSQAHPDLILIEGQSSLKNPSGPCGSEILLSGNVNGVILQHAPFRKYFDELENYGCLLPSVEEEIELIGMYGARTLAVALNGTGGSIEELLKYREMLSGKIALPVILPLQEGVGALIPVIREYMQT